MKKQVKIIISDGNKYHPSVKNGAYYTSVDFQGSNYGAGYPCDNEREIKHAIEHQKRWIIREGDVPIIVDKRVTLNRWIETEAQR